MIYGSHSRTITLQIRETYIFHCKEVHRLATVTWITSLSISIRNSSDPSIPHANWCTSQSPWHQPVGVRGSVELNRTYTKVGLMLGWGLTTFCMAFHKTSGQPPAAARMGWHAIVTPTAPPDPPSTRTSLRQVGLPLFIGTKYFLI